MKPFLLQHERYLENQDQQQFQKVKPDDPGRQNNIELTFEWGMRGNGMSSEFSVICHNGFTGRELDSLQLMDQIMSDP